jgi:hypothetical protein
MVPNSRIPRISNGFKSRKLWYAVSTSIAIVACAVGAAFWPAFGVNFGELIGGLLGALAIYTGTNIGSKLIQGKNNYQGISGYNSGPQIVGPPNVQPVEEVEEPIEE